MKFSSGVDASPPDGKNQALHFITPSSHVHAKYLEKYSTRMTIVRVAPTPDLSKPLPNHPVSK
jgi:hypothetical protein